MKSGIKKLFLFICFIVAAVASFFVVSAMNLETKPNAVITYKLPEFSSLGVLPEFGYGQQAVVIDGYVVYENGTDAVQPTASTAKMILALAVMEARPFELGEKGETLTISADDFATYSWYLNNNGSNTAVVEGGEISQYDALASVLLASSNNMADSLAVWAFGSIDDYREYVEELFLEWEIHNTTIGVDASGYSDTTTSTAADLARIGQKVIENPVLAEIVGLKELEVPFAGTIKNSNSLLGENEVIGVKTGWIGSSSGHCLVSAYMEGDSIITVAFLGGSTKDETSGGSREIIVALQESLAPTTLLSEGQVIGYYEGWWMEDVPILASGGVEELVWDGLPASVTFSEAEGVAIVTGLEVNVVPTETVEEIPEPSFWEKLMHVISF